MKKIPEYQSIALALVKVGKHVEFTLPLTLTLPGDVKEYNDPELSVVEIRTAALKNEISVEIAIAADVYFVFADDEMVQKATSEQKVVKLLEDAGVEPGAVVEMEAELVSGGSWLPRQQKEGSQRETLLVGECKVSLHYRVLVERELQFLSPSELDGEAQTDSVHVETIQGHFEKAFDLSLPVEFAAAVKKVTEITGCLSNEQATALCGWIKVEGKLVVTVCYLTKDDKPGKEAFVFPVKYFIEKGGVQPEYEAEVSGQIAMLTCRELADDGVGLLRGLLVLKGTLTAQKPLEYAVSSGSNRYSMYYHHDKYYVEEVVSSGSSQTLIERELFFSRPVRLIREPVDARVRSLHCEIIPNKIIVRGVLHKRLFAVDDTTDNVFLHEVDESFVHFVDVPGAAPGMRAHVKTRVEYVQVDMNPDRQSARQVAIIEVKAKVKRLIKKDIIVKQPHHDYPGQAPQGGRYYIVRSQDTVWKIARMFGVSMEAVIAANKLQNPNLIFPGQKLFIPQ